MIRRFGAVFSVLVVLLGLCACGPLGKDSYQPPSLRTAAGARVTDGELHIRTGSQCLGTTEVYLVFDMGKPDAPALQLTAPAPGVDVEFLTVGGP